MEGEALNNVVPEPPRNLGIADLLEHDLRPSFIAELGTKSTKGIEIIFCNASLRSNIALGDRIRGESGENGEGRRAWIRFRDWIMQPVEFSTAEDTQPTLAFRRILWSRITLQNKWRVICANESDPWGNKSTHIGLKHIKPVPKTARETGTKISLQKGSDSETSGFLGLPLPEPSPNWSLPLLAPDPTGYWDFVRGVNWASTPLGPMENWPEKLMQMCDFIIRDSRPASMYWGPRYVMIYNEAYGLTIGSKHPELMGKTIVEGWPESCDALIATMEKSRDVGRSSVDAEWQIFLERMDGRSEETYWSWSVVPLYENKECVGYVSPVFETTKLRIGERRLSMLNDLGQALAKANDVNSYWQRALEGLESANAYDVPFAMLYSAAELTTSDISSETYGSLSSSETKTFRLEGSLGVPEGHKSAPLRIDLSGDDEGLIPYFQKALNSSNPIVLQTTDGSLTEDVLEGFEWRGFGDACTSVAVCPLRPTKDESVMGLLMIGLNPRRPYDSDHRLFISLLSQKLTTNLASSVLFEEEVRRGRNAAEQAAFDRSRLSEQLALRTKEFDDATRRLQVVCEVIPIGLCFTTPDGHLTYANNTWNEITGFENSSRASLSFASCVAEQDLQMVTDRWAQLISSGHRITIEFRIKSPKSVESENPCGSNNSSTADLTSTYDVEQPGFRTDEMFRTSSERPLKWVLATVSTGRAEDGRVEMVTISLTDITTHKRTAEEAIHRAQQAEQLSGLLARFKRMAELATVGLFDLTPQGKIAQANDTFYKIMGLSKIRLETDPTSCWLDSIVPEDLAIIAKNRETLAKDGKPIVEEIRLRKPWIDHDAAGNPVTGQMWILATTMPVKDTEGTIVGLTGCVTDISVQKAKAQIALERADLLDQVLIRTREAKSSEEKFVRFAEAAPIGISIMTSEGCINYCNKTWFKITHHPKNVPLDRPFTWISQVENEDLHIVQDAWQSIMSEHASPTIEFRMKHPWVPPGYSGDSGPPAPTWLMSSYFPEIDENGNVKSIMSCLSDISHFKWAESIQMQRTTEALESKRQQENFIDITSHEMRNPLSAIVQCADLIVDSLEDMRIGSDQDLHSSIDGSIDAAQTIISCAQHQKSIVDDILTLSKLDSDLLTITPIAVNPIKIMKEALKIFAAESRRAEIKLSLAVDQSVDELKVDWVILDPSRLLQVLINLLANALKFTQTGAQREVTVTMSAHVNRPSKIKNQIISYIPTRSLRDDLLPISSPRLHSKQHIYLQFAVEDTGRGLTDSEKKLLFKRFSQASPRTHIQYGGSGLGLFISRELTELQGGEIGVASESGVGSTFAFYVKTQRIPPPDNAMNMPKIQKESGLKPSSGLAITVLIVEDNLINQAVLSKQLRKLGCIVDVANHGGEALDFIKTTRYWKENGGVGRDLKIILLDIEMPVMDGLACARTIRQLQREDKITEHIPIIAVSANARSEQIATAISAGMDDVVVKPFRIPELIPKIRSLVDRLEAQTT